MNRKPKILSLLEDMKGHTTYGYLLKEGLRDSSLCQVDFYWFIEEQEIETQILRKLLKTSFPNQWVRNKGLDFRRFRGNIASAIIAKRLASRKLKQQTYSALHFHSYILAFLSIDLMKKLPTVVSLDMTSLQAVQESAGHQLWTYKPILHLGKQVFDTAARIVTFSEWARKSVIEDYQISEEKVEVVYPGVDLDAIDLSKVLRKETNKLCNFLFVGGDFKRKGGEDVLAVFLERFADKAELNLVTQASIECHHPNVRVYNDIKAYTPEWLKLYHQADVFIMPTRFDAFGWVFIEAMSAGLPVIATRTNAVPEIVIHGETGFLVQPGDRYELALSMQKLIENPTLRHSMGVKGQKIVEQKFNARNHSQTLDTIFQEVAMSDVSS